MKPRKIANLLFIVFNFLLVLYLAEKVQNPKNIYENIPLLKKEIPTVLPASDVKSENTSLVTRVIDGDTIELSDGGKVRYIGIDTPEAGSKNECFALEAKKKNEELVLGKNVSLEKDISETDKYQRLLRYVYIGEGENKIMVNEALVKEGFANVLTYPPDVKFKDLFLISEKSARDSKLGLWSKCV